MDQNIREMQERLDKIRTDRSFLPAKAVVDYSEMSARLPLVVVWLHSTCTCHRKGEVRDAEAEPVA